jgi:hypothetical protein
MHDSTQHLLMNKEADHQVKEHTRYSMFHHMARTVQPHIQRGVQISKYAG